MACGDYGYYPIRKRRDRQNCNETVAQHEKKLIYNYYYILYCVPATRVYSNRSRGSGGQADKFRSKNPTETRLMAARRFELQTARIKVTFWIRIRFADVNSFSNIVIYIRLLVKYK